MPIKIKNAVLYDVREVSQIVSEHENTTRQKMREGLIQSTKLNRVHLIEHSDLVEYLEKLNLPESIIDYRLGLKSPKTGKPIEKSTG